MVGLANYIGVLTDDPDFWNSVRVTLVFTLASVTVTLVMAMLLAVLLAGGRSLEINARTLLVIPFAMSPRCWASPGASCSTRSSGVPTGCSRR